MKKYIINGGKKLSGEVAVSGSKNVVLKAVIAACLTDETVELKNVPLINDFYNLLSLVEEIGGSVELSGHTVKIKVATIKNTTIPLEMAAKVRTSSMFLAPLLLRAKNVHIPNPGGCRIGARPIDRHIKGLEKMGATITYDRRDGYFHASTSGLTGTTFEFEKNTHTGTETMILAATLARDTTILKNAATEPEVDDLIALLSSMGANIKRTDERTIVIEGVEKLHGTSYTIVEDRNEVVTFAIASCLTGGNINIKNCNVDTIQTFLREFKKAGGDWEQKNSHVRFFIKDKILPVDIETHPHPGFMTDWQAPWAVLMTQAQGDSMIHETVYEDRFNYVQELRKMGAHITLFNPHVPRPKSYYNFDIDYKTDKFFHAAKITGPTSLHEGVVMISDLRAGATLVIAALAARGQNIVYGVETIDRGYEQFDTRLKNLGADIKTIEE